MQHIRIVTNTGQHDISTIGGGGRAWRMCTAMLGHPRFGLSCGAVIDRHIMTGGGNMSCHRISHHTQSEK